MTWKNWKLIVAACFASMTTIAFADDYPSLPDHITSRIQVEALDQKTLGVSGDGTLPSLSTIALALIKDFEQWMPNAYNDGSSYCTIGYGHLMAKQSCDKVPNLVAAYRQPLAMAEGLALLDKDTGIARSAVFTLVQVQLSDAQFGALASFVFNVGSDNFARSTMLKYLNKNDFNGAAGEFPKWIISKKAIQDGLIVRRNCEAALFKNELHLPSSGVFSRSICGGLGAGASAEDLIDIDIGEVR